MVHGSVRSAYGGLRTATSPIAGADLGASWQTLSVFDAGTPATPRGIIVDLATDSLAFRSEGLYLVSVTLSFEHNDLNAGRTTQLRFWNIDDSVQLGNVVVIGTGRNAAATNYSASLLFQVDQANVNDKVRLEIGNGSVYTSVSWTQAIWLAWSVGPWVA